MVRLTTLAVTAVAAVFAVSAALAQPQQTQTQRVGATIERVEGNTVFAKPSPSPNRQGPLTIGYTTIDIPTRSHLVSSGALWLTAGVFEDA
jgi:hypothetical protein